ncbi:hypothetical protein ACEPAI_2161 [Sanghuangporus weigelae]
MVRILQFAYEPHDKTWRNLLFVNRYFRDVTCQASHLWTAVDMESNPRCHLERSASRGLFVHADVSQDDVRFDRWIDALNPHVERWEYFLVATNGVPGGIDDSHSLEYQRLQLLRDFFRGRTFPTLESLCVIYESDMGMDLEADEDSDEDSDEIIVFDNERDPSASIRSFFSSWNMPALRSISARGFIPILPQSCLVNLTRLNLELGDLWRSHFHIHSLRDLIDTLRGLTALESMALSLFSLREFVEDRVPPVELARLRFLSVESERCESDALDALFDAFSAPNIRELFLRGSVDSSDLEDTLTNILLPDEGPCFKHLEKLTYCVTTFDDRNEYALEDLFRRIPQAVQHLTICGWMQPQSSVSEMYDDFDGFPPSLRTLRFVHCLFDTFYILNSSIFKLVNHPNFETLELQGCPLINAKFLREVMPGIGKKLTYIHE